MKMFVTEYISEMAVPQGVWIFMTMIIAALSIHRPIGRNAYNHAAAP